MVELNKIYCMDNLEFMRELPDESVDCIITSPPYCFGKEYDKYEDSNVDFSQYSEWLQEIFKESYRILKDGGRIFVNVQPVFSEHFPTHHVVSNLMSNCGFTWGGEILWEKNNYNCNYTAWGSWCSPSQPYLKYTWEYIEYFYKNSPKHPGNKENIDIVGDEFKKWTTAKWAIAPERRQAEIGHPAMFPEELVERILKLFTFKGDVVYDPFVGAGTTCVVCEKMERKYIGTDISENYCDISRKRIQEVIDSREAALW